MLRPPHFRARPGRVRFSAGERNPAARPGPWLSMLFPAPKVRRRSAAALLFLAVLLSLPSSAQARRRTALEKRIDAILDQSAARRGFWGIVVAQLPGGKELYSQNAAHLFQPASNLKLFTTAAALEKLGPDFTCLTTVESDAPPDAAGRVGNLYIVGRGDANFASSRVLPYSGPKSKRNTQASLEAVANLAGQIAARGVREVTGNLIADDSYFVDQPYPPDWAVDDMVWGYGAPVTALVFNDNTLLLHIQSASAAGAAPRAELDPLGDLYTLEDHLVTGAAGSPGEFEIERAPGSSKLDIYGSVPAGAPEEEETVAIQDPSRLIADLLRKDLEARGIKVDGEIEVRHLAPQAAAEAAARPAQRDVLAAHRSLPLSEDVQLTLKVSQNLHAEILLCILGHEIGGAGSRQAGLKVLGDFTGGIGIPPDEVNVADGSGLSRKDLVAPDAIIKLLEFMARSPRFQDYYRALPVAGIDGTLSGRFKGTPLAGRLHAKTGTIEHVNSLSGYMDLPDGRRLAVSIIGNADPLKSAQAEAVIDKVALEIFNYYSRRHRRFF